MLSNRRSWQSRRAAGRGRKNHILTYYHCGRCCAPAGPNCARHKQQIEIFYKQEITKIPKARHQRCANCGRLIGNHTKKRMSAKCEHCGK